MGIIKNLTLKPFTSKDVSNRELIIRMLRFEDSIIHSEEGRAIYRNPLLQVGTSRNADFAIKRKTLTNFGFDTTDASMENYLGSFRNYYRSPTDYDSEVISSVTYMRENRLIYYKTIRPTVNQIIPNCKIQLLEPHSLGYDLPQVDLHSNLKENQSDYYIIHAFSTS